MKTPLIALLSCSAFLAVSHAAVIAVDTGPGVDFHTTWESFNQDVAPTFDAPSVEVVVGIEAPAQEIGGDFCFEYAITNNHGGDEFFIPVFDDAAKIETVPSLFLHGSLDFLPATVGDYPRRE